VLIDEEKKKKKKGRKERLNDENKIK